MQKYRISVLALTGWVACAAMTIANPLPEDVGGGLLPKKLIAVGWDSPDPEALLANLRQIEKTPFSGVRIQLETKDHSGRKITLRNLFTAVPWKEEWFQKEIELLKRAKSEKLTDNFLSVGPGPAIDWFDDGGWEQVVEHFRLAARIAKEGGLKGLMFDPETGRAAPAFSYMKQSQREKYSFAEYAAKACERGRQVMEVLGKEYPDMTIFTLFMNSGQALGSLGSDPRDGLEGRLHYSLYPAFVNGWLDAVPPAMTIVDGAEYAYPHSSEFQYLKHGNAIRNTAIAFVAPENRAKYRAQVQAGLAIYMDAYVGAPIENIHSDVFKDPPIEGRLVDRLQSALISAQEVVDQYVWVWGEQYRWWPTDAKRVNPQSWDDILPGASEALRKGMDPEQRMLARADREFAISERKIALRGGTIRNLIQNGAFAPVTKAIPATPTIPASWTANQTEESKGVLRHDASFGCRGSGSARVEGAANAAFSQEAEITPYGFYKLRVRVRQMGVGQPEIRVRWVYEDGTVTAETLTATQSPRDGWQLVAAVLHAPPKNAKILLELAVKDQQSLNDVIWFDDVELIPILVN